MNLNIGQFPEVEALLREAASISEDDPDVAEPTAESELEDHIVGPAPLPLRQLLMLHAKKVATLNRELVKAGISDAAQLSVLDWQIDLIEAMIQGTVKRYFSLWDKPRIVFLRGWVVAWREEFREEMFSPACAIMIAQSSSFSPAGWTLFGY